MDFLNGDISLDEVQAVLQMHQVGIVPSPGSRSENLNRLGLSKSNSVAQQEKAKVTV